MVALMYIIWWDLLLFLEWVIQKCVTSTNDIPMAMQKMENRLGYFRLSYEIHRELGYYDKIINILEDFKTNISTP